MLAPMHYALAVAVAREVTLGRSLNVALPVFVQV